MTLVIFQLISLTTGKEIAKIIPEENETFILHNIKYIFRLPNEYSWLVSVVTCYYFNVFVTYNEQM